MVSGGIFDLSTPQHLFQKLQHDCQRVTAAPGDRYAAIDFLIVANHLRDWLATSEGREVPDCPLLEVCNELANTSKHHKSSSRGPRSRGLRGRKPANPQVRGTKVVGGAFQFPGFQPSGSDVGHLVVELAGDAEKEFGPEIGIEVLADKVVKYWAKQLNS